MCLHSSLYAPCARGVKAKYLNRMIGFSVSFMYERSGYTMPIYGGADAIDLVGVANIMKAIMRGERKARGYYLKEKNDLSNISELYWNDRTVNGEVYEGNKKSKYFVGFNSGDGYLSFESVVNSQFLSTIAGVGILFISADRVSNYKNPKYKLDRNSIGFWLESARLYNGGKEGITNKTNMGRIEDYIVYLKIIDSRNKNLIDQYSTKYLPTLVYDES